MKKKTYEFTESEALLLSDCVLSTMQQINQHLECMVYRDNVANDMVALRSRLQELNTTLCVGGK